MRRKWFAKRAAAGLLLAVLLTVQTAAGTLAFADETETAEEEASTNIAASYYGDQIAELTDLSEAEREDAKAVYDALLSVTYETETIEAKLPNGIEFTTSSDALSGEQEQEAATYITHVVQTALDAYAYDHPEIFWLDLEKTTFSCVAALLPDGTGNYTYTINVLKIAIAVDTAYSAEALSAYAERFTAAVDAVTVDETSRYTIVKSIHDMLIESNVYDLEGAYAHDAYGGLVDGHSVCEGYAEAFKVLCDKYEIPCVLVSGVASDGLETTEEHEWNYVQMEDGNWYGVDVTWDDQGERGTFYDFLLAGADTVETNFGGYTFSVLHTPDGDFNGAGIVSFTYPTLSGTAYESGDDDDDDDDDDTPLYGDVDGEEGIKVGDALFVLRNVVGLQPLTERQTIAADVDGETGVKVGDALCILKHVVGLMPVFPVEQMNAAAQ